MTDQKKLSPKDEKRLEAIHRTMEETKCPEGVKTTDVGDVIRLQEFTRSLLYPLLGHIIDLAHCQDTGYKKAIIKEIRHEIKNNKSIKSEIVVSNHIKGCKKCRLLYKSVATSLEKMIEGENKLKPLQANIWPYDHLYNLILDQEE